MILDLRSVGVPTSTFTWLMHLSVYTICSCVLQRFYFLHRLSNYGVYQKCTVQTMQCLVKISMKAIGKREHKFLESLYEQLVIREVHKIAHSTSMYCCPLEDSTGYQYVCTIVFQNILCITHIKCCFIHAMVSIGIFIGSVLCIMNVVFIVFGSNVLSM